MNGVKRDRFHNQLALQLGYERILDRNIDIHVDDSMDMDDVSITIEVMKPSMKIRFSPAKVLERDNWTGQISTAQKRQLFHFNLLQKINTIIDKAHQAYIETKLKKF